MVTLSRANIREENSMEKAFMYGPMVLTSKEILKRELSKVKENGGHKMENSLLAHI